MRRILRVLTILLVSSSWLYAQERTVSGKVTGEDGSPLPGITIRVNGTNTGTATDVNGYFKLSASPNATLIVRGVGFNEKTVEVGAKSSLTISLTSTTKKLDELVVTAFGIKRAARSVGYATATVNNKELTNAKVVNVANGLTGRVSGLQINMTDNGIVPGIHLTLRGNRHVNASNEPLVVVDGQLVTSDVIYTINPEDIESVNVLKGASASALYGSEASNGVIIFTTKKGTLDGKPVVKFSTTTTLERLSYIPKMQNRFGSYGNETGIVPFGPDGTQAYAVDPNTGFANYIPYENQSYGPEFTGDSVIIGGPLANGQVQKVLYKAQPKPPVLEFFQTGVTVQNDLSLSGGDKNNSYFLGLQDVSTKGVTPNDQYRRTSVRFDQGKTYGKFRADYGFNYVKERLDEAWIDFDQNRLVYWNVLNTPVFVPIQRYKNVNDKFSDVNNYFNAYYPNPWWQVQNGNSRQTRNTDRLLGNLTLNYQATPWLGFTYKLYTEITNDENKNTRAIVNFSPYSASDPWSAGNIASSIHFRNGIVGNDVYYRRRLEQNFLINFNKKFGDISVTAFLGNALWDRYARDVSNGSTNLFIPNLYNVNYLLGQPVAGEGISDNRLIGVFGDVTVGYKDFLFLHGSGREDWTSLLAKQNNHFFYPDIDASFVFTDAIPSLKDIPVLSFGKINAAYSVTGEVSVDPYSIQNIFFIPSNFPYGNLPGLTLSGQLNNPGLKPEFTYDRELGIELGLLNDRINLKANYYFTNTLNQTFAAQFSAANGFSQALVNAGNLQSSGWEFDLNAAPLINTTSGFRWDAGANFAIYDSKVIDLNGGSKDFSLQANNAHAVVGLPYPQLEVNDLVRDPANGKVVVDPVTGYPARTSATQIVGRTTPRYILGLNTSVSYKNFTLSLVVDYRGGYILQAAVGGALDFTGVSWHSAQNGRQRFIFPNSEIMQVKSGDTTYSPNTTVPVQDGSIGFWVNSPFTGAATNYIINAAAWKLRTASLTYDFSHLISKTKFIKGASISVVGQNLLMFVPSQNVWTDPEFNVGQGNATGYTNENQFPPTRKFGASLSFTF